MNRLVTLLWLFPILFSCTSPVSEKPQVPAELYLTGTRETIEVSSGSNVVPISFSTNQSWTVRADVPWLSLSSERGSAGDVAIVATVEENHTGASRTGNITIKAGSASKRVSITQSSADVISTKETLVITATVTGYSTFTVSVTTNTTKQFFFDVVEKAEWDKNGYETIWRSRYRKEAVQSNNVTRKYTGQKAKTEYLAFAAFCDESESKTSDLVTEVFVTDEKQSENVTVPIAISASRLTPHSFVLTFSSTSTEKYYCDAINKSVWDQYGAETVWYAYIQDELEAGTLASNLVSGEVSYGYENVETDHYIAFAAYCNKDGSLKSTIFTEEIDLTKLGQDQNNTIASVTISTNLALLKGESWKLTATCHDEYFHEIENETVIWSSNNPSVATIDQYGVVKALNAGRAIITAKATNGSAYKDVFVFVATSFDQPVDLGLSVKWAQINIGAKRPEGAGGFYRWGETESYVSSQGRRYTYSGASFWRSHSDEVLDDNDNLYRSKDPANHLLGKKWHTPTKEEFEELFDKCSYDWVNLNGVRGCMFMNKSSGLDDSFLFFPRVGGWGSGHFVEDKTSSDGTAYWSSTIDYDSYLANLFAYEPEAYVLELHGSFNSWIPIVGNHCSVFGNSIRPVYSDDKYFDLIVSDITSSQCVVTTGTNSTNTYYVNSVSKSLWDSYGGDRIWQAYVKLDKDNGVFNLYKEDHSFLVKNLSSKTEYVIFAGFCNQDGSLIGKLYSKTITTD